jgi:hypothetical protein
VVVVLPLLKALDEPASLGPLVLGSPPLYSADASALFVPRKTDALAEYRVRKAGTAQQSMPSTTVCRMADDHNILIRCVGTVIHDDRGRLLLIRGATDLGPARDGPAGRTGEDRQVELVSPTRRRYGASY